MAKIFITGGAGFIGYFITKELLERGNEVTIYDNFLNYISPLESHYPHYLERRLNDLQGKARIIRGDVRYRGFLVNALKEVRPEVVIHLAAIPIANVSNQFSEDAIQINLNGTITTLETIRVIDSVRRFVYASSSFVYGDFKHPSVNEEEPTVPIDLYGGTKLAGEIFTKTFGHRFDIEYTIIRPSAVYGPTDCNRRVSQIFIENALQKEPLILDDGGKEKVDFTYVEDVAKGFVLATFHPNAKNQIFNITRGQARSTADYAHILKGLIPGVKTVVKKSDVVRPKRGTLDISKARDLLGYNPKYSLEEGLKLYVDFVKKYGPFKIKKDSKLRSGS